MAQPPKPVGGSTSVPSWETPVAGAATQPEKAHESLQLTPYNKDLDAKSIPPYTGQQIAKLTTGLQSLEKRAQDLEATSQQAAAMLYRLPLRRRRILYALLGTIALLLTTGLGLAIANTVDLRGRRRL
ncbi:hypothetical protein F4778DRAFT_788381 [Xylariomycetidae sp. FL2044]|nr:hypothetical protein F4778DRAFT_788381 [Xylariomycetidae sp. FL2044]